MKLEFLFKQDLWLSGGVSGAIHDLTIAKEDILKEYPDKIFIGDKECSDHEKIVTLFKSPQTSAELHWCDKMRNLRDNIFDKIPNSLEE